MVAFTTLLIVVSIVAAVGAGGGLFAYFKGKDDANNDWKTKILQVMAGSTGGGFFSQILTWIMQNPIYAVIIGVIAGIAIMLIIGMFRRKK